MQPAYFLFYIFDIFPYQMVVFHLNCTASTEDQIKTVQNPVLFTGVCTRVLSPVGFIPFMSNLYHMLYISMYNFYREEWELSSHCRSEEKAKDGTEDQKVKKNPK